MNMWILFHMYMYSSYNHTVHKNICTIIYMTVCYVMTNATEYLCMHSSSPTHHAAVHDLEQVETK